MHSTFRVTDSSDSTMTPLLIEADPFLRYSGGGFEDLVLGGTSEAECPPVSELVASIPPPGAPRLDIASVIFADVAGAAEVSETEARAEADYRARMLSETARLFATDSIDLLGGPKVIVQPANIDHLPGEVVGIGGDEDEEDVEVPLCQLCDFRPKTPSDYRIHMLSSHDVLVEKKKAEHVEEQAEVKNDEAPIEVEAVAPESKSERFSCDKCGLEFAKMLYLVRHQRNDHDGYVDQSKVYHFHQT